jgi:hypothetical protein
MTEGHALAGFARPQAAVWPVSTRVGNDVCAQGDDSHGQSRSANPCC